MPVFVLVDGKPHPRFARVPEASRRSAEWRLKGVDQCWSQKEQFIKASEAADAKSAYEHAREVYRRIVAECEVE
jgi:hypothetical protein